MERSVKRTTRIRHSRKAVACIRLFAVGFGKRKRIMKTLHIPCDPGEISDGYHTFNELYDHRCTLFLAVMKSNPSLSWISTKHHDGSEWDGWFIAGMRLPSGDVTYHLPAGMWSLACETGAEILERGHEWDGHTSSDVVTRIQAWLHSANSQDRAREA